MADLSFYQGKKVLVTGHTGFKGAWLCVVLVNAGATVIGYSSCTLKGTRLFDLCGVKDQIIHIKGDVRDLPSLMSTFAVHQPEIVIHMAAQSLVRESYIHPVSTYETNVMGTVNILECVRKTSSVKSFLNVTTDKVYCNREWVWGYRENEELDGYDPYSNSKSCSELVTHSYVRSFFMNERVTASTARAGNVIGGGDFARNRIIPDCVNAAINHKNIIVRNPFSIRPYQHVLEPLFAYLLIIKKQYQNKKYAGCYNVGPNDQDCLQTGKLVDLFVAHWGNDLKWISQHDGGPHEAKFLKLDCSRLKTMLGWSPRWNIDAAVAKVVEWSKCWIAGDDIRQCMDKQIKDFLAEDR